MSPTLTRVREHAGWFAALFVTAGLVAGLSAGVTALLDRQALEGLRSGLTDGSGAYEGLRVGLPLAPRADEQDAQVRAMLGRRFESVTVPIEIDRTVQVDVDGRPDGGTLRRVTVLALDDAEQRLDLVDGAWPDDGGVLVHADAAAELGLAPGSTIELEGTPFGVAGTWRPVDRLDPRWLGDAVIETGRSGNAFGPIVLPEAVLAGWDDVEPQARWTLVPALSTADITDLAAIPSAWTTLHRGWEGEEGGLTGLSKSGRLLQTVDELQSRVAAFRAVEPLALLLLGAIAVVTFAQLARLLTTLRADETALLWSRGASPLGLAARTAGEVAAVAALGSLLGVAAAVGVLQLVSEGPLPPLTTLLVPCAVTTGFAALTAALSTARNALRQTVREPSDGGARRRRVVGGGLLALAVAAAALSVWQLRLYGSPVTPTADGGTAVDPVTAPAPALTLAAVALAALALHPAAARLDERLAHRAGVGRLLAARTVARRPELVAAPVLIVALGVGSLVTAAGYQSTWSSTFTLAAQLRAGADVRVSTDAPGLPPDTVEALGALPGVTGIAPVALETLQFGAGSGTIVAVAPDALRDVASRMPASFDLDGAAEAIRVDDPSPALPADTRALTLSVETEGLALPAEFSVFLRDSYGLLRVVSLEIEETATDEADPGVARTTYRGAVPEVAGRDLRVASLEARLPAAAVPESGTGSVEVRALTAQIGTGSVDVALEGVWYPDSPTSPDPASPLDEDRVGFGVGGLTDRVRLTPTLDGTWRDQFLPAVVVSQALADRYDIAIGDTLNFSVRAGTGLRVRVADVLPAIPTSRNAVALLLDLGVLQHYDFRLSEAQPDPISVWIATDDVEATVAGARDVIPANGRIDPAADPAGAELLGAATIALWITALGCATLAVAGVVAAGRSLRRERRRGIAILRVLGLTPAAQAAMRARELGVVIAYGGLAGLLAGGAVVLLTVGPLARAAVPRLDPAVPSAVSIEFGSLGIALLALTVVFAAVLVAAGGDALRESRTASPAEESR